MRVHGENAQRRRRINDDVVVILQQRGERVFELERRVELAGELLLDFGQSQRARAPTNNMGSLVGLTIDGHVGVVIAENVKHGGLHVGGIEKSDGGVGLRVQIDQQGFFLSLSDGGGEIDGSGGLAHAALLIGNSQDGRHRMPAAQRQDPRLPGPVRAAPAASAVARRLASKPCGCANLTAWQAQAQAKNWIRRHNR